MMATEDPIRVLIDAPLGWLPASYFGTGGLDETNGELDRGLSPDGRRFVTLTALEAARRSVHLVEISGRLARRAAWRTAWPEAWAETEERLAATADRVERFRLLRAYLERVAWIPLVRWAAAETDDEGLIIDNGPPPIEPREQPCVVLPKRIDWIRAADWRLELAIEEARRELAPTTPEEWRVILGIQPRTQAGPSTRAASLDPALRRLLLEAERDRRAREKARRKSKRQRRPA